MQGPSSILAKMIHSWYLESKKRVEICFHHWTSEIIQKWHFWKNICLVIGSGFIKLSILWNCTTVLSWGLWVCLSVNLALTSCVELRPACEIFVADCTCSWGLPLSSIDIFLSTAVAKCQQLQENSAADSICHIDYQI